MKHFTVQFLAGILSLVAASAAPIVLYETGWEPAPAVPAWMRGNVAPQNGWDNFNLAEGHQVVANGSTALNGQQITTPYGRQFHQFLASSSPDPFLRAVWPDITDALADLPPSHTIFKASIDVFVPLVQDGVAALHGIMAFHDGGDTAPWGVLVDPSDLSVNIYVDDDIPSFETDAFELDTWFNLSVTANYFTGEISVQVNGVTINSLTTTSTEIASGLLTDVDLVTINYEPSAPAPRAAFSDNFRLIAEASRPQLSITPATGGQWKLCWTAGFADWILESTQDLSANMWHTEMVTPTIMNGVPCVLLPNMPPQIFYRLRKP